MTLSFVDDGDDENQTADSKLQIMIPMSRFVVHYGIELAFIADFDKAISECQLVVIALFFREFYVVVDTFDVCEEAVLFVSVDSNNGISSTHKSWGIPE